MSESVNVTSAPDNVPAHIIQFPRPYLFEGKSFPSLDLSALESLTVQDAIDIQRDLFGKEEAASLMSETTSAFAQALAVKASGKPVEFFQLMAKPFFRPVFRFVRDFIMNTEHGVENHVLHLEKPCSFQGKSFQEIDLSGIADLTSLQECYAENRMAREGFVVTENSFNFLYACVIASLATGLPEDFFTGLPLRETVKLKNAVNDAGFFE